MNSFVRYAIWLGCTVVVACGDGKSGERDGAPADRSRPASGQDGGTDRAVDVDAATDHVAPPRVDAHPPCVFSADCPAGQYCDLGECVQDCNTDSACAPGLSCSPRGRCAAPGAPEEDPPPVTRRQGAVTADPASVVLTDGDDGLSIRLATDSKDPVRYRVQIDAPHLSIPEPRGEFTGSTVLPLRVDASRANDIAVPGTVKIFTTLGDLVIDAPIQVGVSGRYQGALTYDGGDIPLGSVGIALDLQETHGDVLAEIDPDRSLLFPPSDSGPVTGRGTFTLSDGVELSIADVRSADFGGDRNHFHRPLGRSITLKLEPGAGGVLSGSFEEKLYGLFREPVTLTGNAYLERRPLDRTAPLRSSAPPAMPGADSAAPPSIGDVFPGWTASDCVPIASRPDLAAAADAAMMADYLPLYEALQAPSVDSSDPIGDIAALCRAEIGGAPPALANGVKCAVVPRLACALRDLSDAKLVGADVSTRFGSLFAETLDPALLVAQDDVVKGVKDSFVHGVMSERGSLDAARSELGPPALWVLQPKVIDYLSRIPSQGVASPDYTGEPAHVHALRTLSRLFYVLSTIDGESSNLAAADRVASQADRVRAAQERGVLTLFEAATVAGVLASWGGSAPPDVGTEFTDVLSPMDRGFRTLVQGALVFGVPEGVVPFLYNPGDASSNFDQVLKSVEPSLTQFTDDETAFTTAERTYEQNADTLDEELVNVETGLESQLADLCGQDFDVSAVKTDADWAACGANHAGEVGSLLLGIDQAQEKLRASHGRVTGMSEKIDIEYNRIRDVKGVRDGTIAFIKSTGEQLDVLTVQEGVINVAEKCLEVASNSSLTNFGAPAGMAVVEGILEAERTAINVQRQNLQTAQEARIRADDAKVEVINGMATIKGLMVDMTELGLEMQEDVLGVLQSEISVKNAIDRAKRLAVERTRTLAHIAKSPAGDPTFRILEDRSALRAIRSRSEAQRGLYLAGRALEYQLDQPFGDALGKAVFNVYSSAEGARMKNCLQTIARDGQMQLGAAQSYTTELSLRKVLGITGPRKDDVTGVELSPGDQFRALLLRNENLDASGGVGIEFSSNLEPGNGLWPSNVCDDTVTSVEAQLVGDFLGDNEAEVDLSLDGGGVLRRCDREELSNWSTSGSAVVQAGVNTYGTAPTPNASLRGLSVASARWKVVIPGATTAPANADVSLDKLDDIVLRIHHEARPIQTSTPVALDCLSDIGAGL